jgi:hypothetical protein
LYPRQNFSAHHRVNFHLLEFLGGEFARFRNDVLRHCQLSDVV